MIIDSELARHIKPDESFRSKVYDDATGKTITKGMFVQGVPTIGWGRNLVANGISPEEGDYLFNNDIQSTVKLLNTLPWFLVLSEGPRRNGIIEMVFQLGFTSFLGFHDANAYFAKGDFKSAAREVRDSLYYRKFPRRVEEIAYQIEHDRYPRG